MLLTTVPKAGTHLAAKLLDELPGVRSAGLHLEPRHYFAAGPASGPGGPAPSTARPLDERRLARSLRWVHRGQYVTAHMPHRPGVGGWLARLGFRVVVVVRDPRDVAVSALHYVEGRPDHWAHDLLAAAGPDRATRLLRFVEGTLPPELGLPDLGALLDGFLGWLDEPNALVVRFEDLVGPRGGGDTEAQHTAARRIVDHLGLVIDDRDLARALERTWSSASVTFRRGEVGAWRSELDAVQADAFRRLHGDRLARFGYGWEPTGREVGHGG